MKKVRDIIFVLIAYKLAAGFFKTFGWSFVLDDHKRHAVHIADDVATFGLRAADPFKRYFSCHMVDVVLGVFPIDEFEGVAF